MQLQHSLIEPIVIGTGVMIMILLAAFVGLDINPELSEYNDVLEELFADYSWLVIFPLLTFIYVLGILMDMVASIIFRPWENNLRKNTLSPDKEDVEKSTSFYFNIRNFLYSTEQTASIVQSIRMWRSRIRLCRSWAVISLLLCSVLVFIELTSEFDPYRVPIIIFFGLLLMFCLIGWHIAQDQELKWMEPFKQ